MSEVLNPLIYERTAPIEKAKAYIRQNFAKTLTLEEVAGECGMSRYYFSRTFKKSTGKNFKAFVNEVRIKRAKELLLRPEIRITEVCYAIGYNELSYFDRVFNRATGLSPSAFKKKFATKARIYL